MWHEVRKQERKIRCMIVDYKRRAERRKDYYEKIKADPTQFLQIHGRPCKIHLDPAVAMAGDSPANMMSWQGSADVIIDRFDVRAHLDYIPEVPRDEESNVSYDDRHINYERYRILVQNDFLGVGEEKFLHQLHLEEQYGAITRNSDIPIEGKKKVVGAAIGFNYEDPSVPPAPPPVEPLEGVLEGLDENDDDDEDSDIDFDVCVDVNKVTTQQAHELNTAAHPYGMEGNDFFSFLTKDREEADNLRIAKELEEEKAMYSGRKSRRERRAYREKKLAGRIISPPSYASRKSPTYRDYYDSRSNSRSRTPSPVNSGKITYITSFGGEETSSVPISPKPRTFSKTSFSDHTRAVKHRSRSPDSKFSRHRSRSRSGSRLYNRRRSRSRSNSRSQTKHRPSARHRRDRSQSKTRPTRWSSSHSSRRSRTRSKSITRSPSRYQPQKKSRSKSPTKNMKTNQHHFEPLIKQPPAPIISRYYGRRGGSSSSELSLSDEETKKDSSSTTTTGCNLSEKKSGTVFGNSSSRIKTVSAPPAVAVPKVTPQERLKKKMQALINKQYKADKKAEREKREKVEQERIDREDEMREISIKLRKRERMRRHEYLAECDRQRSGSSHSRSRSRSNSRGHSPRRRERRRRTRTRSRSRSRSRSHSRTRSRPAKSRSRSSERLRVKTSRPLVDY